MNNTTEHILLTLCRERETDIPSLARDLGLSEKELTRWINGRKTPCAETVGKVASHFCITPEELFLGKRLSDDAAREAASRRCEKRFVSLVIQFALALSALPTLFFGLINAVAILMILGKAESDLGPFCALIWMLLSLTALICSFVLNPKIRRIAPFRRHRKSRYVTPVRWLFWMPLAVAAVSCATVYPWAVLIFVKLPAVFTARITVTATLIMDVPFILMLFSLFAWLFGRIFRFRVGLKRTDMKQSDSLFTHMSSKQKTALAVGLLVSLLLITSLGSMLLTSSIKDWILYGILWAADIAGLIFVMKSSKKSQ